MSGGEWTPVDAGADGLTVSVRWEVDDSGRHVMTGLCVTGPEVGIESIRRLSAPRLRIADRDVDPWTLPPPIRRPGAGEAFAEMIAERYRAFQAVTSNPGAEMARLYGVPVGTVHGWIHEARLRGKLPPGRKGRAG